MRSLISSLFFSLATAMCHYGTTLAPRSDLHARAGGVGYHGLEGPLNWHALDASNAICASGTNQSPINLDTSIRTLNGSIFDFNVEPYPEGVELENLGSTIQVHLNGSVKIDGKDYSLVQFHFHTPSEHHLLHEHYPLEVHFVFQSADESLAVVGFMIDVAGKCDLISDSLSAALANIESIPAVSDTAPTDPLDFEDLVSHIARSEVYSYDGSLTTPPCTEGVRFNIVAEPVFIDVSTFKAIRKLIKFNSRYIQNVPGQKNLLQSASEAMKASS